MMADYARYMSLKPRILADEKNQSVIKYPFAEVLEKKSKEGGRPLIIQKTAATAGRNRDAPFAEYGLVEREFINEKGENEGKDLAVQSEAMQKALHSILNKHSPASTSADPIIFRKPYYSLFHCREEIRRMAKRESNDEEQTQHLEWLAKFMTDEFNTLEKVQEGLVDKGLIEFKHLPIIFEAGSIVIGRSQVLDKDATVKREKAENTESPECFLFHKIVEVQKEKETGSKHMDIEVFRWWYNGSMFGPSAEILRIKEFSGPRKITDLDCFPLTYLKEEEKDELIPKLMTRGQKWCNQVDSKMFHYEGVAQVPKKSTWSWDIKLLPKNMPGRVLLDHQAFTDLYPELNSPLYNKSGDKGDENEEILEKLKSPDNAWKISSNITIPRGDLWTCVEKKGYQPTGAQALLCPASSFGYSLQQKDWGCFDIDLLRNVEWATNPIKELEMPALQKELLQDLIMEHNSRSWRNERILGKGEGLIFLLHGPPGCGKTLTAELMAEEDKRALVRISCSDLGQLPHEVERKLQALLDLAVRGAGVVLIDEADTFLSERKVGGGTGDYFHNAIVGIFLKHLEYFPGVIFLTTNQETKIDEAVSSRVIRLSYSQLDGKSRAKIWKNELSRGGRLPATGQVDQSFFDALGDKFDLDGREIKTLANLSLKICRRREQGLSREIIQQIFDLTHGTRKPK